jgi:hypothetical protein
MAFQHFRLHSGRVLNQLRKKIRKRTLQVTKLRQNQALNKIVLVVKGEEGDPTDMQ